jgi:transglutaminase-like putative cysteine protease
VPWQDVKALTRSCAPVWLDVYQYIPETAFTAATPEILAYALQSFRPAATMYEATHNLMERIYQDFEFKPGFTTISTPLSEVMKARKGVCQDFAHLAIACVRAVGLPARYVSGYLETIPLPGKEKLAGADASHAWFSVYIPHRGWIDFDPTNNQIPAAQYITASWGRDYADIAPLKGVIINSGPHELSVSVDVKRLS